MKIPAEFWTFAGVGGGFATLYYLIKFLIETFTGTAARREEARKKKLENEFTIADRWEEYSKKMEDNADRLQKKVDELLTANASLIQANRDLQELNFKLQRKVDSLHSEIEGLKGKIEASTIVETKVQ